MGDPRHTRSEQNSPRVLTLTATPHHEANATTFASTVQPVDTFNETIPSQWPTSKGTQSDQSVPCEGTVKSTGENQCMLTLRSTYPVEEQLAKCAITQQCAMSICKAPPSEGELINTVSDLEHMVLSRRPWLAS